ncbi:rod shape-determining protein RodA [Candidatus Gottesmanbacteria bacterium]|nr:rod shape-determining protein RodA [Candidatus Gottesmanbacteria bacterium]
MNFANRIDYLLLIPVFGLVGISLSLIASTTPLLFTQQLIFIILGFVLYIIFASIDFRVYPKFLWIFYTFSIILLLITFFGHEIRGSSRWIDLGWFRMQPSELIKPFFIIMMATLFAEGKENSIRIVNKPFLFFLPIIILIFKQPDLGNVLVYLFIFMVITVVSGVPVGFILTGLGGFSILLPVAWTFLKQYQKDRLLSFLDPHGDPIGAGYNALQAVIAIGSGQILGLGLGRGTQSHLLFLPEYHTDFVFASIGEELGFLGGALVIIFYAILLARILFISSVQKNRFARILSLGLFAQLFIQVFINIGMNLGILPITGITLPLVSYGGSSIISTFISLGIAGNISRTARIQSPIVIK